MSRFKCHACGESIEWDNFIEHIKDDHSEAYYDALDEVVREYFGDEAIHDEE